MDYYDTMHAEDFDGEFPPEMYYDDPDYSDVAHLLQSGWLGPDHVERFSLGEVFERCVSPTFSQAAIMVLPLVTLSMLFKVVCTLATEIDRPQRRKLRKPNNTNLMPEQKSGSGKSQNGNHRRLRKQSMDSNGNGFDNGKLGKGSKHSETPDQQDSDSSSTSAEESPSAKKGNLDYFSVFTIHSTSALFGLMAAHLYFQWNIIYLGLMSALLYIALLVTFKLAKNHCGPLLCMCVAVYILVCELLVVDRAVWTQIRGAAMIIAMKVISIGFDLDVGVIPFPELHEFVGYTFNIGTVIFGPWISFQDYMCVELQHKYKMGVKWLIKIVTSLMCSAVCLIISTCFVHWLILDGSYKWMLAYRDAQSFRFSHYFVSYLSEVTAVSAGLGALGINGDITWDLTVARSYNIEFPRSLVEVVTNWNLPMHYWLKTYVFRAARPLGTFSAILLTYAASSLLHGLNFQLAAVLFSLGFYSYVEYVLRKKLARIFNACIEARKCKEDCGHEYKWRHPAVMVVNFCLAILSVFHLAYLGLMFDSSGSAETGYTMEHTLNKWAQLDYASHWIAVGCFIFYFLI